MNLDDEVTIKELNKLVRMLDVGKQRNIVKKFDELDRNLTMSPNTLLMKKILHVFSVLTRP